MKKNSVDFIKRYKVRKMADRPDGSDITLCSFKDLESAINWAKSCITSRDDLAVFEFTYASEENLKRDFHFDYCLKWAAYL